MNENSDIELSTEYWLEVEKLLLVTRMCSTIIKQIYLLNGIPILGDSNNDLAIILHNTLSDSIVLQWNIIWGNYDSNELHYRNLAKNLNFPVEKAKALFLKEMNLTEEEYKIMHDSLVAWRNKIIAHIDFKEACSMSFETSYYSKIKTQCFCLGRFILDFLHSIFAKKPNVTFDFSPQNGSSTCKVNALNFIAKSVEKWATEISLSYGLEGILDDKFNFE